LRSAAADKILKTPRSLTSFTRHLFTFFFLHIVRAVDQQPAAETNQKK
jgi:hypothetical protein